MTSEMKYSKLSLFAKGNKYKFLRMYIQEHSCSTYQVLGSIVQVNYLPVRGKPSCRLEQVSVCRRVCRLNIWADESRR